jgi:hypothetical protein
MNLIGGSIVMLIAILVSGVCFVYLGLKQAYPPCAKQLERIKNSKIPVRIATSGEPPLSRLTNLRRVFE